MNYNHLTTFERGRIQELLSLGYSHRNIAKKLGRHHSCIDREINRNTRKTNYVCEDAQMAYHYRRKSSVSKGKHSANLHVLIVDRLKATWSPEQIANTVISGIFTYKTIYNWIYAGILPKVTRLNLRHKGKRKKVEKRGKFSMGTSDALFRLCLFFMATW